MIRQGVIISMILVLLFVVTAFLVSKALYDQTAVLEGKVAAVESHANAVKDENTNLKARFGELKNNLNDEVTKLRSELTALKSEISDSQKKAEAAGKALQQITEEARLDVLSFPLMIGPGNLPTKEHLKITRPGLATYKASSRLKSEEMKNVKKVIGVWWVPRERPQDLTKFVQIAPIVPGPPVSRNGNRPLADNEFWIDFLGRAP